MVVFYPLDDGAALLGRALDELEEGPGYTCFGSPSTPATVIAAWAPGGGATKHPDDLGIAVEPGRPLIVQMHYNTAAASEAKADSTKIELQSQRYGITPAAFVNVLDLEMNLPAGQTEAEEIVTVTVGGRLSGKQGPVEIYGVFPHMHTLGKSQRLTVRDDAGQDRCMLALPAWDFNWQRMYFYDEPLTVDAAQELRLRCLFDTSSRSEVTRWDENTTDEMCVAGLFVKL